ASSFFFSSRRRHTRSKRDWSSDVCSSDLDETRDNGNLDAWRLVDLFEVERTGEYTFVDVYPESLTTNGVWEFALREKGQPQFMRSEERRVGKECGTRVAEEQ